VLDEAGHRTPASRRGERGRLTWRWTGSYIQHIGLSTKQVSSTVAVDQLSTTFAALADPTRRAILARLADGEATVNELAEPFPVSIQAVSKHLKVLERAGLITRGRHAQLRPSRLQGGPLKAAADWLEEYREFWEASFDSLDEHLRDVQKGREA
jgi:DNA-binding transcriptional ArsR family regulator